MSGNAIVHIGLPKCASTSIQSAMRGCDQVNYLGKVGNDYRTPELEDLFRRQIPFCQEMNFDVGRAREILAPEIAVEEKTGKPVFLSDEILSGIGFGSYIERIFLDPVLVLDRLAGLFDTVSIVIVIREQWRFLESFYAQMVGHGFNLTFQQFIEREFGRQSNLHSVLSYGTYLRFLKKRYGSVHVLLFEDLIEGAAALNNVLAEIGLNTHIDLPHLNRRSTDSNIVDAFVMNCRNVHSIGLYPNPAEYLTAYTLIRGQDSSPPTEETLLGLNDEIRRLVENEFARENRAAGEVLERDLGAHGYVI